MRCGSLDSAKGHRGNWNFRLVVAMSLLPPEPLFNWESLREISPHDLGYAPVVPGELCEVELTSWATVRAWGRSSATTANRITCTGDDEMAEPAVVRSGEESHG